MAEPAPVKAKSFRCPQCAGQIDIRNSQSEAVICQNCGTVLDVSNPDVKIVTTYQYKTRIKPLIPLGQRGTLQGETFEVLGFLTRTIRVDGMPYTWCEYMLWNPFRGYRWIAEYNGHWTYIKPITGAPQPSGMECKHDGKTFKKFQTADAEITYVIGEFNWQIRRGDRARCVDFVCPPFTLSMEKTPQETVWSAGEYVEPQQIWTSFKLEGQAPDRIGIGAAQPNPYTPMARPMHLSFWIFFLSMILIQMGACAVMSDRKVHEESFVFNAAEPEKSKVSQYFQLDGRASNVELKFTTNVSNNWIYLNGALINEDAGTAIDFGKEIEFYSGVDGGESWSEGSGSDTAFLPSVPAGKWYLRLDPEMGGPQCACTVQVYRDVPRWVPIWFVLAILLLPFLWFVWRKHAYEVKRWSESDYPIGGSSDDDDD